MRRTRWIALAVLPALLLAGDFGYWRLAVNHLGEGFEPWASQTRTSGWDIRHGAITAGGWPDAATLRVENLTVSAHGVFEQGALNFGALHLAGLDWGSDAVLISTGLARPGVLEVTPVGVGALRLNEGPTIPVSADHMRLRLSLRLNAPPRVVDFEAVTMAADIPGLGLVTAGHLSGHVDLRPGASRDQPAVTFSFSAGPVALPDHLQWGLGPEISEFELEGVLNGPIPSDTFSAGPGRGGVGRGLGLAARATTWRDGGGSLELHRLGLAWGPTRVGAAP